MQAGPALPGYRSWRQSPRSAGTGRPNTNQSSGVYAPSLPSPPTHPEPRSRSAASVAASNRTEKRFLDILCHGQPSEASQCDATEIAGTISEPPQDESQCDERRHTGELHAANATPRMAWLVLSGAGQRSVTVSAGSQRSQGGCSVATRRARPRTGRVTATRRLPSAMHRHLPGTRVTGPRFSATLASDWVPNNRKSGVY